VIYLSNLFEKLSIIEEKIEKLKLIYRPECDSFDEKAWNKEMNRLLNERRKLLNQG
jgi:hypothetical protein